MADLITTGATDMPIEPFRIERFSDATMASTPSEKEQDV
jgi:sarcosine oxidase subunit beta